MMEEVDVEGLDAAVVSERRTVRDAKSFFLLVNHTHVGYCRLRMFHLDSVIDFQGLMLREMASLETNKTEGLDPCLLSLGQNLGKGARKFVVKSCAEIR
jgi:hypothetical protein